jgi:hypothetical protein
MEILGVIRDFWAVDFQYTPLTQNENQEKFKEHECNRKIWNWT